MTTPTTTPTTTEQGKYRIVVKPELEALIRPLSQGERDLLRESIQAEGIREPILIWVKREGNVESPAVILDGHNRYSICQELGTEPKFQELNPSPASLEEAKLWMLTNQLGRRNLTDDQRKAITALRYELRAKLSRSEQVKSQHLTTGHGGGENPLHHKERLRKQAAKESGFTEDQLRPVIKLQKEASDLNQMVIRGELTLKQANAELRVRYAEKESEEQTPLKEFKTNLIPDDRSREKPGGENLLGDSREKPGGENHLRASGDESTKLHNEARDLRNELQRTQDRLTIANKNAATPAQIDELWEACEEIFQGEWRFVGHSLVEITRGIRSLTERTRIELG